MQDFCIDWEGVAIGAGDTGARKWDRRRAGTGSNGDMAGKGRQAGIFCASGELSICASTESGICVTEKPNSVHILVEILWYKFGEYLSDRICQISGYTARRLGIIFDLPVHKFDLLRGEKITVQKGHARDRNYPGRKKVRGVPVAGLGANLHFVFFLGLHRPAASECPGIRGSPCTSRTPRLRVMSILVGS